MKKDVLKMLVVTTVMTPIFASDDDQLFQAQMRAAIRASMEEVVTSGPAMTAATPGLPESVAAKLARADIHLDRLRELGSSNMVDISLSNDRRFMPSDIAHINHVLFDTPLPAQHAAVAAKEAIVAKMMAVRDRADVERKRVSVSAILAQLNTGDDVHEHDSFCAGNIEGLLQLAKDTGFGKGNYRAEAAAEAVGPKSTEIYQIIFRFMEHFSQSRVQAQHGVSSDAGDKWIADAVKQAANNPQVLSLVAYTISILDELKGLEGDPIFDNLKFLALQQIMENYKENGGCLEGVRNRAMKSLAMLLNYILNP